MTQIEVSSNVGTGYSCNNLKYQRKVKWTDTNVPRMSNRMCGSRNRSIHTPQL